jgi:ATP diphosphatase
MLPPLAHLIGKTGNTIDHGHGLDSLAFARQAPINMNKDQITMPNPVIYDSTQPMPRLLAIMARLRDPNTGCPWDIEQDFASIAPYTIEEAYEVADAIEQANMDDLRSELGDLLLQVVFHAQIADDENLFNFNDIANAISDKMITRHPHVFGTQSRDKTPEQQTRDWEAIKAAERATQSQTGTLDGVAIGLPALLRAVKLQKRAARVGFDWPSTDQVLDKLTEEAAELTEAAQDLTQAEVEEEFGDLLFVMANLARHMKVDPETTLRAANAKFTRRFERIEALLAETGKTPEQSGLEEMDTLWNIAKAEEKTFIGGV